MKNKIGKKEQQTKYKLFVQRYLKDFNGKKAAIAVGYSPKTADAQASRLLTNVKVQEILKEEAAKAAERNEIELDELIKEYILIGFSNISDYVEWGPDGIKLKNTNDIDKAKLACIADISETTTQYGGTVKFKMHDKKGALDSMARILGAFNDKMEHTGAIDLSKKSDKELEDIIKNG